MSILSPISYEGTISFFFPIFSSIIFFVLFAKNTIIVELLLQSQKKDFGLTSLKNSFYLLEHLKSFLILFSKIGKH